MISFVEFKLQGDCIVGGTLVGVLMYEGDLLLLFSTCSNLKRMIVLCEEEINVMAGMLFNVKSPFLQDLAGDSKKNYLMELLLNRVCLLNILVLLLKLANESWFLHKYEIFYSIQCHTF